MGFKVEAPGPEDMSWTEKRAWAAWAAGAAASVIVLAAAVGPLAGFDSGLMPWMRQDVPEEALPPAEGPAPPEEPPLPPAFDVHAPGMPDPATLTGPDTHLDTAPAPEAAGLGAADPEVVAAVDVAAPAVGALHVEADVADISIEADVDLDPVPVDIEAEVTPERVSTEVDLGPVEADLEAEVSEAVDATVDAAVAALDAAVVDDTVEGLAEEALVTEAVEAAPDLVEDVDLVEDAEIEETVETVAALL